MKEYLEGSKECLEKLDLLDKNMSRSIARNSCRAAAKVIAAAWKADAPRKSGMTAAAVKVRAMKRSRNKIGVSAIIGAGEYQGKTFYAAFVEKGHLTGKRGSKNRKQIPARNWMKKSFDRVKSQATEAYINKMKEGISNAGNADSSSD